MCCDSFRSILSGHGVPKKVSAIQDSLSCCSVLVRENYGEALKDFEAILLLNVPPYNSSLQAF